MWFFFIVAEDEGYNRNSVNGDLSVDASAELKEKIRLLKLKGRGILPHPTIQVIVCFANVCNWQLVAVCNQYIVLYVIKPTYIHANA